MCTVHNLNWDWSHVFLSHVCVWLRYCMLWAWCGRCCHDDCSQWPQVTTAYSYCNIDAISHQGVLLSAVILESSHVVALTLSTIQDGSTALKKASISGHHKVVEVLLRAGANPNLENKVSTGQNRNPRSMPYFWCPFSLPVLHVFSCVLR